MYCLPEYETVVWSGLFSLFLLRKHFITEKKFKKKSGDVNDEANFPFFILLHKRAKPILPLGARTQTLYSPLTSILTLTLRLEPLGSIKPLVLPIRPYLNPPSPSPIRPYFKNISLKKYFLMYYININVAVDTTR